MNRLTTLSHAAMLEALIFASSQPVKIAELAAVLELSPEAVDAAVLALEADLATRGVRLQRLKDRLQLVTAPEVAPYVEQLLGLELNLRLSQAALEALSIVAYAQPVTRPQVESIRGVNSGGVLRTLMAAGLIEEIGRAESVGRPILYGITFEFLQQFGLEKAQELPPLEDPEEQPPE